MSDHPCQGQRTGGPENLHTLQSPRFSTTWSLVIASLGSVSIKYREPIMTRVQYVYSSTWRYLQLVVGVLLNEKVAHPKSLTKCFLEPVGNISACYTPISSAPINSRKKDSHPANNTIQYCLA